MSRTHRELILYTDGACSPNPGPGGYGVVLISDGKRRELAGGFRRTTNNRMELLSVIRGLQAVAEPGCSVTIYCDSQYVVSMYNGGYVRQWQRDGWTRNKGKDPALNSDLWSDLLDLCAREDVRFVWVRGHADNAENTRCDQLAVQARQAADLPVDEGYETPAVPVLARQLTLFEGM